MKMINGSPSWITALVLSCFFSVLWAGFWFSASTLIEKKQQSGLTELEHYQGKVLASATEALSAQLVPQVLRARELSKARIFRGAMDNFSSMKQENRDRAQEEFDSFIGASGFLAGRLFTPEGSLQATTEGKLGVPESDFYAEVRDVASTRQPYFSPRTCITDAWPRTFSFPSIRGTFFPKRRPPRISWPWSSPCRTCCSAF
jgi:hypothetical protein